MNPAEVPLPLQKLHARVAEIQRKNGEVDNTPPLAPPEVVPSSTRRAVAPGAAPVHFVVQINGEAVSAAATTEPGTGNALLTVMLVQRYGAVPVVAVRRFDSSATSHTVARAIAKRLRNGTQVHVSGKGLCMADHEGKPVLRVLDVQAIDPPLPPLDSTTTRKDLE
jgi:hypothetical protein